MWGRRPTLCVSWIKASGVWQMITIRYIHVFSPYWYVTFMDPDGNPIEITDGYTEEGGDRE